MDISKLSERIVIQKNETLVDKVGNHINVWKDYYSCAASAYIEVGKAKENVYDGLTLDGSKITFLIRFCKSVAVMDSTNYRVLFKNNMYNILSVDFMNFNSINVKLRCEKEKRQTCLTK